MESHFPEPLREKPFLRLGRGRPAGEKTCLKSHCYAGLGNRLPELGPLKVGHAHSFLQHIYWEQWKSELSKLCIFPHHTLAVKPRTSTESSVPQSSHLSNGYHISTCLLGDAGITLPNGPKPREPRGWSRARSSGTPALPPSALSTL